MEQLLHIGDNKNNQPYRDLFEQLSIGLLICHTDGHFIDVNEPFCKLMGYSKDELLLQSFQSITHPDDIEKSLLSFQLLKQKKIKNYTTEKRYIRKDKSLIWVKLGVSPIVDNNNNLTSIIGTIEDITTQKETEDKLTQSKKDWKHIFQAISHPTTLLDKNHKIIDVNDSVIKLIGKTREELIGASCYQVFHSNNKECPPSGCPMDTLLKSGKTETLEMEMEAFNGTFLVSCTPIMDNKGETKNIIHVATDITYLKQIEQELQESETRYRILLDTSPVGIAVHCEGKIVFTNQTGSQLLKANSPNDIIGKNISEIIHPTTLQKAISRIKLLMAGETGLYPAEDKYICFDGTVKDVQVYANLINYRGKPATQIIVMDISESKRVKEEIIKKNAEYYALNEELTESLERIQNINSELEIAKQKAEESDHLKTAFLQNMSHEIRTPLNAIMGFSELLPKTFKNEEKLKKFTTVIQQRSTDLLEIVTDILDISKIESGQVQVNLEECNLNTLFTEVETFFTEYCVRIKKEHVKFKLNLHCNIINKLVIIDAGKLKQILTNLISNAFKFTHSGVVEVGCNVSENNILSFYVKDSGIGILKEKQSAIFERFMQASSDTSKLYGGTGLGLSIVKGLLNLVGGEIWLDSEFGKGSTFYFTFPYSISKKEKNLNPIECESAVLPNTNATILIVEDDFFNAEYLKEILLESSYSVIHTEYGAKAIEIATHQNIDRSYQGIPP